jgi:D-glycerate 3-kinase
MNPIASLIARHIELWRIDGAPLIVGICGEQASGKSTASAQVAEHFEAQGLHVAVLSLDDLYIGRAARAELAAAIHHLYVTRGPAGTHDVALGIDVLAKLKRGDPVRLPRFTEQLDEPLPRSQWPLTRGRIDIILFEGWCVGARPQEDAALAEPVNVLERGEDPDGVWRRAVNAHLGGSTATLFSVIDKLIYLRPPSFDIVYQWRCQQEHAMIAQAGAIRPPAAMDDNQIARFIAHYQRMTCHIANEMPARADLLISLGEQRQILSFEAQD